MFEFTKDELEMFLKDVPFFSGQNSFCLGDNLADAGKIFRRVVEARERKCGNG